MRKRWLVFIFCVLLLLYNTTVQHGGDSSGPGVCLLSAPSLARFLVRAEVKSTTQNLALVCGRGCFQIVAEGNYEYKYQKYQYFLESTLWGVYNNVPGT